MMVWHKLQISY